MLSEDTSRRKQVLRGPTQNRLIIHQHGKRQQFFTRRAKPPRDRQQRILNELQVMLLELGLAGIVKTVVTLSGRRIYCYGQVIKDGVLLHRLNLSIGHNPVSYRSWSTLTRWNKGVLVKMTEFIPNGDPKAWVALVGFRIAPGEEFIPYKNKAA